MFKDERVSTFIISLEEENSPLLEKIEQEALAAGVPIICRETASLLKVLLRMQKPTDILEVGTAVGFSALLMGAVVGHNCHITTIDNYEKHICKAKENFKRASREEQITLLEGDAALVLKELKKPFDFIFMDAAKGQYLNYLPDVMRLLRPGGILISDNVLLGGEVLGAREEVRRRNRTRYDRMREYLYVLKHHEELETCVLSVGDGVAVSYRLVL